MFSNNLIAGVSGQSSGGYSIEDSLRFNDNDSAYLSRTPSVAGDRKTWTWSGWVKRGNLGTRQSIFVSTNSSGNNYLGLEFRADNKLAFLSNNGSASEQFRLETNGVFRDVSGWYHIVVFFNSSDDTASNRAAIYVNGVLQTYSTTTLMPKDYESRVNSTEQHNLGTWLPALSAYLDGYLAEINFIDGQALTADDFGQIDATTGEWSPKKYSGTYGTNGFYLPFNGNANDSSGNGNNWTENNLASTDYMVDTPTNNFATYLQDFSLLTLSEGNLETFNTTVDWQSGLSSIGVSSGKWYAEYGVITVDGNRHFVGITPNPTFFGSNNNYLGSTTDSYGYYGRTGGKYTQPAGQVAYGAAFTAGDIIGVALDMDAGTVTFYKNNVSQGVAFTGLTGTMFIGSSLRAEFTSETGVMNFGADSSFAGNKTRQGNTDANGKGDFYYTPPAGYLALCTDNLPAPAIEQPETQFNVVTYTGNGTSQAITDVGFQPDFVWIKKRNTSDFGSHQFVDIVRGLDKYLFSDATNAEVTAADRVISFDSDGFSLSSALQVNENSDTYVAWCWKAGGIAVSNTDGAITSQVSANVDAGFSIVSYTATNSSSNVGHGLNQAPELIMFKSRTSVSSWTVYTTAVDGSYDYLRLNGTDAKGNSVLTAPSSSVMYVNNTEFAGTNVATNNYIAYAFHSVEGFSKIGSFVGNGSANGTFVYTGFKPAFILVKRTDGTGNWVLKDTARDTYNPAGFTLLADVADAEYGPSNTLVDILSNGFKPKTTSALVNASGGTYIYMAFAEHPFNYATGR